MAMAELVCSSAVDEGENDKAAGRPTRKRVHVDTGTANKIRTGRLKIRRPSSAAFFDPCRNNPTESVNHSTVMFTDGPGVLKRTSSTASTSSTSTGICPASCPDILICPAACPSSPASCSSSSLIFPTGGGSAAAAQKSTLGAAPAAAAAATKKQTVITHIFDDKPIQVEPCDFRLFVQSATGSSITRKALQSQILEAAASGRLSPKALQLCISVADMGSSAAESIMSANSGKPVTRAANTASKLTLIDHSDLINYRANPNSVNINDNLHHHLTHKSRARKSLPINQKNYSNNAINTAAIPAVNAATLINTAVNATPATPADSTPIAYTVNSHSTSDHTQTLTLNPHPLLPDSCNYSDLISSSVSFDSEQSSGFSFNCCSNSNSNNPIFAFLSESSADPELSYYPSSDHDDFFAGFPLDTDLGSVDSYNNSFSEYRHRACDKALFFQQLDIGFWSQ